MTISNTIIINIIIIVIIIIIIIHTIIIAIIIFPTSLLSSSSTHHHRSLVEAFIHKSVNTDTATRISGPYLTSSSSSSSSMMQEMSQQHQQSHLIKGDVPVSPGLKTGGTGTGSGTGQGEPTVSGFLLFEEQVSSLLTHNQGGTPLFLRLFLRCLQYAASRGYCLWLLYESWMTAQR